VIERGNSMLRNRIRAAEITARHCILELSFNQIITSKLDKWTIKNERVGWIKTRSLYSKLIKHKNNNQN
jgi:hypothetical protein